MDLGWYFFNIVMIAILRYNVLSVTEFSGDTCVQAHNNMRKKHVDTKELIKSKDLENAAKQYARRLRGRDTSFPIHPTRSVPRRKRRSLDDGIDENLHLELWDGDITYPSSNDQWFENLNQNSPVKIGRSIHKFCCSRYSPIPHCPKEFFHGLSFPPTSEGVVSDMYNEEEKHYDYTTGKSKTIFSHVNHFARVVWKNTSEVGCGQSLPDDLGCVFTVVLYKNEGAVGSEENFMENIGRPIVAERRNPTMKIVLVIFIVALIIGIIVLIYCCRHNIDEKYKSAMIDIDVLKAEQELETDSTSFWWMRPLVKKKGEEEKESRSGAAYQSIKEKPSIDVVTPMRPRPSLKNIPRPSLDTTGAQPQVNNVSQLVNRYRGISMKRQDYMKLNYGENPYMPPSKPPMFNPNTNEEVEFRQPSGKSVPPPPAPSGRPKPAISSNKPGPSTSPKVIPSRPVPPKPPASKQQSFSDSRAPNKPQPSPRPDTTRPGNEAVKNTGVPVARKPMLPPKRPSPPQSSDTEEERPMSIAERRKLLEGTPQV